MRTKTLFAGFFLLVAGFHTEVFSATDEMDSMVFAPVGTTEIDENDTVIFAIDDPVYEGDFVSFPVYIKSQDEVNSMNFSFQFNLDNLTYDSYTTLVPYLYSSANYNQNDQTFRFTSYALQDIEKGVHLVTLRFHAQDGKINPADFFNVTSLLNGSPCTRYVQLPLCDGQSVTLTAHEGTASSTYAWNTGEDTKSISVNSPGEYYCSITSPSGTFVTHTMSLSTINLPSAVITANGSTTICDGDSVELQASFDTSYSYTWNTGDASPTIYAKETGDYYTIVENPNRCAATSNTISITVNPAPTAQVTPSGIQRICQGDSLTLTAYQETGYSYYWSNLQTGPTIHVKTPGYYQLQVYNEHGCSALSGLVSLSVNPLPVAIIDPEGPTNFCDGDSLKITANEGTNLTYLWNTLETTRSVHVKSSGQYYVEVTDVNNCTKKSNVIEVKAGNLPSDITNNGQVDIDDFLLVAGKFGTTCINCPEDINKDDLIDVDDFLLLAGDFNTSCN